MFKRKESASEPEKQKRLFCSDCQRDVFLNMKFCDECGGELEWPKEYKYLLEYKPKEQKKLKNPPITTK